MPIYGYVCHYKLQPFLNNTLMYRSSPNLRQSRPHRRRQPPVSTNLCKISTIISANFIFEIHWRLHTFRAATETSLASFSWMAAILFSMPTETLRSLFLSEAEAEERLSEIPEGSPRKAST